MTLREVASRAGVSLQTVSNVINGRASEVGEETRKRVRQIIDELGYQPNANARGLRSRRTNLVGYLPLNPEPRFLGDPFQSAVLSGIADALRAGDHALVVRALDPADPGGAFANLYRQRRFDGAVVHLSGPRAERDNCVARLADSGCPFVLVEEKADLPRAASVRADNRRGAEDAVRYLHSRGHKRIDFLRAGPDWPAVADRQAGYEAALAGLGLTAPRVWTIGHESVEEARAAVAGILAKRPARLALLCGNDVLAVGAVQAAKAAGRKLPDEVAVVGFDDFEFARYVDPPLTTVRLPPYEMGHKAAELILAYLAGGRFPEAEVIFPAALVVRGTA